MTTSMRFTTAQRAGIIAGAVASGRIPAAKAPWYQAEIAAGGTRAGPAIAARLASYPAGHPIGQPVAAARTADEAIWQELFGPGLAQPAARPADEARKTTPMTAAEYRVLYPEPGTGPPPKDQPLIPELSGYVPSARMTAPAGTPGPQLDQASRARVRADLGSPQIAPLAVTTHAKVTAWHEHEHADGQGGTHSHQHVHRDDGSHEAGPGHAHDTAPDTWTPELASRARPAPARGPRPFTFRVPAPDVAAARQAMTPAPAPAPPPAMSRDQADAELAAWWRAAQAGRR